MNAEARADAIVGPAAYSLVAAAKLIGVPYATAFDYCRRRLIEPAKGTVEVQIGRMNKSDHLCQIYWWSAI